MSAPLALLSLGGFPLPLLALLAVGCCIELGFCCCAAIFGVSVGHFGVWQRVDHVVNFLHGGAIHIAERFLCEMVLGAPTAEGAVATFGSEFETERSLVALEIEAGYGRVARYS